MVKDAESISKRGRKLLLSLSIIFIMSFYSVFSNAIFEFFVGPVFVNRSYCSPKKLHCVRVFTYSLGWSFNSVSKTRVYFNEGTFISPWVEPRNGIVFDPGINVEVEWLADDRLLLTYGNGQGRIFFRGTKPTSFEVSVSSE